MAQKLASTLYEQTHGKGPMTQRVRVMVSSCGRRVQLLEGFRRALRDLKVEGTVITCDAGTSAPASYLSDRHFRVPRVEDSDFVARLLDICIDEGVDVLVPTIDTELKVFARYRTLFGERGTTVVVSDERAIAIAADKRRTHQWLDEHGLPCPEQWDVQGSSLGPIPLPVVVKPALGSMSQGVVVVSDQGELDGLMKRPSEPLIAQAIASGIEYTVSTYVDVTGRCVAAVPRRRLEVRAGEVSKAVTEHIPVVEGLARRVVESLPGARGPLNVQIFHDAASGESSVIEINARFGGGDPLAWRAGADAPRWILEEHLGCGPTTRQPWEPRLAMLRFDDAVFTHLDESDV